jgi:hypothetical protein
MASIEPLPWVPLRNDQEYFDFPLNKNHAVVVVLVDWCGWCTAFEKDGLQGVKDVLMMNGTPLGIANFKDLSVDLQTNKEELKGFPLIKLYHNGKCHQFYKGMRRGNELLAWVQSELNTLEKGARPLAR